MLGRPFHLYVLPARSCPNIRAPLNCAKNNDIGSVERQRPCDDYFSYCPSFFCFQTSKTLIHQKQPSCPLKMIHKSSSSQVTRWKNWPDTIRSNSWRIVCAVTNERSK